MTGIGHIIGRNLDAAALWVALPVLSLVVAFVIAGLRSRWLERRRLRPKGIRTRPDVIRRDLDRMADYLGELLESKPAVRQPFELGLAAMAARQWDKAIEHFRQAQAKADWAQLIPIYNQTGVCHYTQGRPDDALKDFDESARLARWCGDEKGIAPPLGNIGVILHDYGDLPSALNAMNEALTAVRSLGDKRAAATCLGNIGNVQRDRGELDKALQFHQEALAISRGVGDKSGVASSLCSIASVYCDLDELDEALPRYEQALAISREVGDRWGKASALGNIGNIHRYRGDLGEAFVFHKDALALEREIGYQAGIATELGNIGFILADKGLYEQAVLTLAESLASLLAAGLAKSLRQALLGLSVCDDRLGRGQVRQLLEQTRLAEGSIADMLERIDQLRRRRPRHRSRRRAPFVLRRLATGSPS